MSRKRWRTLVAKLGEIKIAWGRVDAHNSPDLCVAWGDGTDMKCTGMLMLHAFTEKRLRPSFRRPGYEYEPSLIDELEERGFDITTIKFTIQKKAAL